MLASGNPLLERFATAMKFGILFCIMGATLAAYAVFSRGIWLMALWPAASIITIGIGYLLLGPSVFGKQPDGSMSRWSLALLLPYLFFTWGVWHVARLIKREDPYNELVPGVLIGRRLLASELPSDIDMVVDLTSEFPEPRAIRSRSTYLSFPILDGSVPSTDQLASVLEELCKQSSTIYIHCAEGHGRTCLVAAGLLLMKGITVGPDDAIRRVQSCRPLARPSRLQREGLEALHARMKRP
jgi:protein-tyrosine phosphatase